MKPIYTSFAIKPGKNHLELRNFSYFFLVRIIFTVLSDLCHFLPFHLSFLHGKTNSCKTTKVTQNAQFSKLRISPLHMEFSLYLFLILSLLPLFLHSFQFAIFFSNIAIYFFSILLRFHSIETLELLLMIY